LGDRVKFAEHIHYTLRNQQPEKALDLCRLASRNQEVVVGWNHCVDWHMQRGRINEALKIYNEMKKRAQFPDSHTYVLLLRGLSKPSRKGALVERANVVKALSLYNSMFSPTSRVKPNIYHSNAVIKVCSMALDLDAMWGVIAKMPEKGLGAADRQTYTILLTAIRHGAFGQDTDNVSMDQLARRRDKAVQEGRRIWQDVIRKWRAGELQIDEELVNAMGRLLLMSRRLSDWDDVLSLVQQTMQVERLLIALDSPDRHTEHVPQDEVVRSVEEEGEEDHEGYADNPSVTAFRPVQAHPPDAAYPHRPTTLVWAKPDNATLALLTDACTNLRSPKTANAYWDLFVKDYEVVPNLVNIKGYLNILSKNRQSAKVAALFREGLPAAGSVELDALTFRMAMQACVRDKKNPHVLANARTVVEAMDQTLADLDIQTLVQYVNLLLTSGEADHIVAALDRLDPIIHNLRSRVTYGTSGSGMASPEDHLVDKETIVKFLQAIVGVIDTLMNRGMVPRDDFNYWHARRGQLTKFIGSAKDNIAKAQAKSSLLESSMQELEERRQVARDRGASVRLAKFRQPGVSRGKQLQQPHRGLHPVSSAPNIKLRMHWAKHDEHETIGKPRRDDSKDVGKPERRWITDENAFADSPMELSGRG